MAWLAAVALWVCVARRPEVLPQRLGWPYVLSWLDMPSHRVDKASEPAGASKWIKLLTSADPLPEGEDYPRDFTLERVAQPDGSLQVLGNMEELRGSFCWVEPQRIDAQHAVPLLQRLDVSGGSSKRLGWKLPVCNSNIFKLGFLLWKSGNRSCLMRAMRRGSDVGSYRLYELDLARQSGSAQEDPLYAPKRFLVSPSGSRYAFETSDPWSGVGYQLRVVSGTRRQVVSKDPISSFFSWSWRNTLIYCAGPKPNEVKQGQGFPNIYEDDLKGHIKLLKKDAVEPMLSPDGKHLAACGLDSAHPENPDFQMLSVLNLRSRRQVTLSRIAGTRGSGEASHKYLWTRDGRLCVIENSYDFSQRLAFCRIHIYDPRTQQYTLKSELRQQGASSSDEDRKLRPVFTPLKIANGRFLLLQVQTRLEGANNIHVLAVDLEAGARRDILAFTDAPDGYGVPLLDWTDG